MDHALNIYQLHLLALAQFGSVIVTSCISSRGNVFGPVLLSVRQSDFSIVRLSVTRPKNVIFEESIGKNEFTLL